jgi:predicted metalloendopeptidase
VIEFLPSHGIKKRTEVDYKLLSTIFSQFIVEKRKKKFKVEVARTNYSFFDPNTNKISINLKEGNSLKYIVAVLLHEVRHYLQTKEPGYNEFGEYDSFWKYYRSPEERDARRFERLTSHVCAIYENFRKISEKIEEQNKEL